MATYNKPHLSLDDQLVLLKQRGLQVTDDVAAKEFLRHNGYYRLSAYWYPFREIVGSHRSDNFLPNSKFEDVRDLCSFDKKFKLLLLDAIEGVEIAVRAEIALLLGATDTFAHINPNFFRSRFIRLNPSGKTQHQEWLEKLVSVMNYSRKIYGHV